MDYHYTKSQPIALPLMDEPFSSEKQPLVDSELSAQPPTPHPKKSKFIKALKIIVHLFLITVFLRWVTHKACEHHRRGSEEFHHGSPHHKLPVDMHLFDEYPKVDCASLAQWSDPEELHRHGEPRFSSDTSFTLPKSSESLLFLAHGSYSFGAIQFVEDETNSLASSEIGVYINVRYWNDEALEQADVCTLDRDVGHGIGIFTPNERHRGRRHDELKFRISVVFPKSSEDKPSQINNLETSLPLFAHYFPKTNIFYKTLSVRSANLPIFAESLNVAAGRVESSNNVIKGNFSVTDTLEIFTSNAPVKVNVTMYNTQTSLVVVTSNAPLTSNLTLVSEKTGAVFFVDTRTSNAPLNVEFADAPVDSVLHFSGKTSNSPAYTKLHPTYEGSFHVKSSIFRPRVDVTPNVEDPKGKRRERKVTFSSVGNEVDGTVRWDGDDSSEEKGSVELTTSIMGARLVL